MNIDTKQQWLYYDAINDDRKRTLLIAAKIHKFLSILPFFALTEHVIAVFKVGLGFPKCADFHINY